MNKMFFFVAAEGFLYSQPTNSFYRVPLAQELTGDLSAIPTQLFNPYSTGPDPSIQATT